MTISVFSSLGHLLHTTVVFWTSPFYYILCFFLYFLRHQFLLIFFINLIDFLFLNCSVWYFFVFAMKYLAAPRKLSSIAFTLSGFVFSSSEYVTWWLISGFSSHSFGFVTSSFSWNLRTCSYTARISVFHNFFLEKSSSVIVDF